MGSTMAVTTFVRKPCRPVRSAALVGEHSGVAQKFVNETDCVAISARTGMSGELGWPFHPNGGKDH